MNEIFNNKIAFLNKKPHKIAILIILFIIIFILLLIYTFELEIYDNYLTKGYVTSSCGSIISTYIPTNIDFKKIAIDNENLKFKITDKVLEIDEKELISYYKLNILLEEKYQQNQIVGINFYYNKQRMIEKIVEKIF